MQRPIRYGLFSLHSFILLFFLSTDQDAPVDHFIVKSKQPPKFRIAPDDATDTSTVCIRRPTIKFQDDVTTTSPDQARDQAERPTVAQSKQACAPQRIETNSEEGSLDARVTVCEDDDGMVKGVLELSTLRQRSASHIKVRVICLIDVSGSMLLKGDKQNLRSKLRIMKNMAAEIIEALEDEEDFFGVMTFGEESRVICPLTKVSASTRSKVKIQISELDKGRGFSAVTDLSSAMLQAVDMLTTAQRDDSLRYRNCIIVFSDGEVNAGETDPAKLVHVTREKIREFAMPRDVLADLWVNVSCVTTGSNFSHSLYLLSKMCGSDAYFFIDGSKNHPEADMLIPLMLRKTACAQMVSVTIRAVNGATLETGKCSQEYTVRRKRGRETERDTVSYFLHDLPKGAKKTFQICLDIGRFPDPDQSFLSVDIQYVDPLGVLHNVKKSLRRQEVVTLESDKPKALQVLAKTAMNDLRQVLQNTCRNVANILQDADANHDADPEGVKTSVSVAIQTGKNEAKAITDDILGKMDDDVTVRAEMEEFHNAVLANLNKMESLVKRNATDMGRCWQYAKAMSSAVVRELPTVTNVVVKPQVVCPLPEVDESESARTQALSMYVSQGSLLHDAAKGVAQSLADVLKALEAAS
ncbi:uncharacterized protein [Littorina saxatilis]|uniref:uncharacterized protein isoform X1 n=1 Tax=Littorina saxatilis TaxID=31220 RepID=UPI0038B5BF1B